MQGYAVLILGIARSGTSALAGTLSEMGIPFGSNLKESDWQNPKGNYEHKELSGANQRVLSALGSNWSDHNSLKNLWREDETVVKEAEYIKDCFRSEFSHFPCFGIKDPRLVPLFPLYADILSSLSIKPILLSVSRSKQEVIDSIKKSGYYHGKFSTARADALFEHYRDQINNIHNTHGGYEVSFDDLLYQTDFTIQNIESYLNGILPSTLSSKEVNFIDSNLYRNRSSKETHKRKKWYRALFRKNNK